MILKIEHLRYFVGFANADSINQAAKELYISQQQLNRILTSLENEVHATLFVRSSRGTTLTEDGQAFAKYAVSILNEYSAMQNYFLMRRSASQLTRQNTSGRCVIYVPPFLSIYLSDMINKFKDIAPNIELTCIEDSSPVTEKSLLRNQLQFLGCYIPEGILEKAEGKIHIIPVSQARTYLCVNKNSELAGLKEISGEEGSALISTVSPVAPLGTYQHEKLVFTSSNIYQHLDSVVQNNTVCTMTDFLLPKLKPMYPDIVTIPFTESEGCPCQIVYPVTYLLSEADEVLISFLKVYFQNLQLIAQQTL
ncbi:MAG: LysR family transcriptional regulator [Peptococcaceae bacterium]|nr:LysR family transcriptional regulator [Peptococcaceae bacterium]